jgi:hypothetical protein
VDSDAVANQLAQRSPSASPSAHSQGQRVLPRATIDGIIGDVIT